MYVNKFLKDIFPQEFWKDKIYFLMKFSTSPILNSVEQNEETISPSGLYYRGKNTFLSEIILNLVGHFLCCCPDDVVFIQQYINLFHKLDSHETCIQFCFRPRVYSVNFNQC